MIVACPYKLMGYAHVCSERDSETHW